VDQAEMQKQGAAESPPLAVLRCGAKIGTPGQLDTVLSVPEAGAIAQHEPENQQVGPDQ